MCSYQIDIVGNMRCRVSVAVSVYVTTCFCLCLFLLTWRCSTSCWCKSSASFGSASSTCKRDLLKEGLQLAYTPLRMSASCTSGTVVYAVFHQWHIPTTSSDDNQNQVLEQEQHQQSEHSTTAPWPGHNNKEKWYVCCYWIDVLGPITLFDNSGSCCSKDIDRRDDSFDYKDLNFSSKSWGWSNSVFRATFNR